MGPDSTPAASALARLEAWITKEDFAGWDPYDALNSPLLKALSLGTRYGGIFWVQLVKRLPVNLRPLLAVPRGWNPKGIGLFLHASALRGSSEDRERITRFGSWLLDHANRDYGGMGWGYNFPWPGRSFYCPAGMPTVVNTAYIGQAFLRAWRATGEERWLDGARGAARFVHEGLPLSAEDASGRCAAYTPIDRARIPNANMLGAALLIAVGSRTGEEAWITEGRARMNYSLARQAADGSWPYGEAANQQWIDSFHTGYNLLSLAQGARFTGDAAWQAALRKGLDFYLDHFFEPDGSVPTFHDRRWPLDPHAQAHALITLKDLSFLDPRCADLRQAVRARLLEWQEEEGWFCYWITEKRRIRIPFMRWIQAWVYAALVYDACGEAEFNLPAGVA